MTYKEPLTITKILDIIDESSGNIDELFIIKFFIINEFHLRFNDKGLSYPVNEIKIDAKNKEIELMCTTEKEEKYENRYFMRRWEEEYYIFDSEIVSEKEVDEHIDYDDYSIFGESLPGEVIVQRLNIDDEFSSAVQYLMFKNKVRDLAELRDMLGYSHEHKKESQILTEKLSNAEAHIVALEKIIKTIEYDYENAHGMAIRNADWFTAW